MTNLTNLCLFTTQKAHVARKPSRLPYPLRFRSGVILVTLPSLLLVGVWSAAVVYVHIYHYNLAVDEGLVPLLGNDKKLPAFPHLVFEFLYSTLPEEAGLA